MFLLPKFRAAAIWPKSASGSLHGSWAEVDKPSIVKITVCLQSNPRSVEDTVSGEFDVDDTSIGWLLAGRWGLLPIKEMASSGSWGWPFAPVGSGRGWSASGGPSGTSGGSQLSPCLWSLCCWTLRQRFCSASSMEREEGMRMCTHSPWKVAMSWSSGCSWWPMWTAQRSVPCCSRWRQICSTPAKCRTRAGGRRRSVEWAECRKVVTGSMMCTAVMRHAALSAL